jgi:hypothetical protein
MQKADARYKVLVEKKEWAKPSKEEADLMAMKAAIDLEANQSKIIKAGAKKEGKKAVRTCARKCRRVGMEESCPHCQRVQGEGLQR